MGQNEDLASRYVGIDYVAEYQRHWSYLNQWFRAEYATSQDRDAVERMKVDSRIGAALAIARDSGHDDRLIRRYTGDDNRHGDVDLYRYMTQTELAVLVHSLFESPTCRSRLNLFNPAIVDRVRGTATISVEADAFIELYRAVTENGDKFMSENMMSIAEAVSFKGVAFSGSMFYRDPSIVFASPSRAPYAEACWTSIGNRASLGQLTQLGGSSIAPGLDQDAVEMLYVVRNAAVHGDLDFTIVEDNHAARAALAVLDRIVGELTP